MTTTSQPHGTIKTTKTATICPGMINVIPDLRAIKVDTRGAVILTEESPQTRDSRGIYLPNHIDRVSHIALDIGGSLAKVVYFTRSPQPPDSPTFCATPSGAPNATAHSAGDVSPTHMLPSSRNAKLAGALTPRILEQQHQPHQNNNSSNFLHPSPYTSLNLRDPAFEGELLRRASVQNFPGGSLNFERFETEKIHECVDFIKDLLERSAKVNNVSIEEMKQGVKIIATGGGAHKFQELFSTELGVEFSGEEEMEATITGLKFLTLIPSEVYAFSDQLATATTSNPTANQVLDRPSPNPPQYNIVFQDQPEPQLPCLLVNIGSGVSIIKIDEDGKHERISGTSLGGGTLWGLLSLLTPASSFDEMLELSESGDNSNVDMLVGDIYGTDYTRMGLKSTVIASSFGKVFRKGRDKKVTFSPEDISKSLLYAISNNIGQIAYMNAEKHNLDRIYFGGCFIRGHIATITTLSYAIRFWSKGTKRAMFLRHEGFLGSIGAWIKNIDPDRQAGNAAAEP
ncbi:hypothetical protein FRB94_000786 [Tulasnella sp. JGI-2019a]|nr:hypothetical protein FRB93_002662 [Tulasnella sp. JGI-2019a]KAG9013806.1 hypothetical protein FRB94_000786 [Tulasnella sp. JGI-2019a]KAG9038836.1 hypothetical protein FRB95_014385 [Tulasnella sp. JGI-2019a]